MKVYRSMILSGPLHNVPGHPNLVNCAVAWSETALGFQELRFNDGLKPPEDHQGEPFADPGWTVRRYPYSYHKSSYSCEGVSAFHPSSPEIRAQPDVHTSTITSHSQSTITSPHSSIVRQQCRPRLQLYHFAASSLRSPPHL